MFVKLKEFQNMILIFSRYLANRGRVKRHTLAVSNPIHEVPQELQRTLLQHPIRPSRRSSEQRGICKALFTAISSNGWDGYLVRILQYRDWCIISLS